MRFEKKDLAATHSKFTKLFAFHCQLSDFFIDISITEVTLTKTIVKKMRVAQQKVLGVKLS